MSEWNYEKFRKYFYDSEKNNGMCKDLILRIRKENDGDNIVYYNGNKAFNIYKSGIKLPINVYKCNSREINKVKNDPQKIKEYQNKMIKKCKNMKGYFDFSMQKITFSRASNYNEKLFKANLKKFENECESNETFERIGNSIIFDNKITDIKKIIKLQYYFLDYFSCSESLLKEIKFDYKAEYKKETNKANLEKLIKKVKDKIDKYEGGEELEKKYQHQFMLHANKSSIFEIKDGETVEHFEQEYGIINKKRNKEGRIDCIFYKYKNEEELVVTDIYLIELKVNDTVILGDNGVMTHLDDIKAFLDFEDKGKYQKYDLETLKKRIQNRIRILHDKESSVEAPKIHFYTIIGFKADEKNKLEDIKERVISDIEGLCNKAQVKEWINDKLLDKYFEGKTLLDVVPSSNKCDVKFFFDNNNFDDTDDKCHSFNMKEFKEINKKLNK